MPAHITPEIMEKIVELSRQGWTQAKIAQEVGFHRMTVQKALHRHYAQVLKRMEKRTALLKARQLDQLEWVANQALESWKKSRTGDEVVIKTVTDSVPDPTPTPGSRAKPKLRTVSVKTETLEKSRVGDASFLREARGAWADQRKILGLDAPPPKPVEDVADSDFEIDIAPNDPPLEADSPPA